MFFSIPDFHQFFGILAGVVALLAFPVYIAGIVRGKTRPNRSTWWVLCLSGFLLAGSYYASGARDTVWIALAYACGYLIIAIFSLTHGDGGKWNLMDKICFFVSIFALFIWWFLKSPLLAFLLYVAIDFLGILPTIYKTYNKPSTESQAAWIIDSIGSVLAVLAIEKWTFIIALYPLYLVATSSLIALLTFRKNNSNYKR